MNTEPPHETEGNFNPKPTRKHSKTEKEYAEIKIQEMRERIKKLENEMAEIKKMTEKQGVIYSR